jgi:hypothetical protein
MRDHIQRPTVRPMVTIQTTVFPDPSATTQSVEASKNRQPNTADRVLKSIVPTPLAAPTSCAERLPPYGLPADRR